jgi:hypothetical protein
MAWPTYMVRFGPLDIETQRHLVFGQGLRRAAEATSVQLLDDLAQPLVMHPLGEQNRFQRLGIVRQCITRRDQIDQCSANFAMTRQPGDSPRRRINHQLVCVGVAVPRGEDGATFMTTELQSVRLAKRNLECLHSRRQPNNCCDESSRRRATAEIESQPATTSATIRALSSAVHVRRGPAPVNTSTRRIGLVIASPTVSVRSLTVKTRPQTRRSPITGKVVLNSAYEVTLTD